MDKKRLVTVVGAGRSGRGMLGELFYSEGGYQLVFADNNAALVQGLAKQGYYTVEQKDLISGEITYTYVKDFITVDTINDRQRYLNYLAQSEIIGTALFPSAFDQVIQDIIDMIKLRMQLALDNPMAILLGANYVGLYKYYHERIIAGLEEDVLEYFEKKVALITSKVNRKIVFPEHYAQDKYFLTGDNKPKLVVDNKFLFSPDYKYPSFFSFSENAELDMVEKIWSENLQHVCFAFMGVFKGYRTINEAVRDDYIRKSSYNAWKEGRKALHEEYGLAIPADEEVKVVFEKFASPYFDDKLTRIGRQPIRKLGKNDRLVGPALLCLKHGIIPYYIARSIAYGFFYSDTDDAEAVKMEKMIYSYGIEQSIQDICQLDLNKNQESMLYQLILASYQEIFYKLSV